MSHYIKLPDSHLEWEWWGRFPHHYLFEWLLLRARIYDRRVQGIIVRRGSVLTTWNEMQQAVSTYQQCSRGTLSRALSDLSECGEIIIRTDCRKTIVTVCHYEDYNGTSNTIWTDSGLIADCQRTDTPLYKEERKNEKDIYSAHAQGSSPEKDVQYVATQSQPDSFVTEADCRLWMRRYNTIADSYHYPHADQLNTKRQLLIQQRVRERGRGSVDLLFKQLELSALFFNQSKSGFRGDFTNLWTSDVYTKVCEGYYIPQAVKQPKKAQPSSAPATNAIVDEPLSPSATDRRRQLLIDWVTAESSRKTERGQDILAAAYQSGELAKYGIVWHPSETDESV